MTITSSGLHLSVFSSNFYLSHIVIMHHVLSDSIPYLDFARLQRYEDLEESPEHNKLTQPHPF